MAIKQQYILKSHPLKEAGYFCFYCTQQLSSDWITLLQTTTKCYTASF